MKIVAVTSCPTGIAHTYMAAEALEIAAQEAGHEIHVETQGSAGSNPLGRATIAEADAVIFAADVEVRDRARFDNKPLIARGVKAAISNGPGLIAEAEAAAAAWTPPAAGERTDACGRRPALASKVEGERRHRYPAAAVADDRCQLHDPVRRRGRHPHRPRLPVRR